MPMNSAEDLRDGSWTVSCNFDGAAPRNNRALSRRRKGSIVVRAWDNLGGRAEQTLAYCPRLHVRITNSATVDKLIGVTVEWGKGPKVTFPFDHGVIRSGDSKDWKPIVGTAKQAQTVYNLVLAPGIHYLALYPEYGTSELDLWLDSVRKKGARVTTSGTSATGLPIHEVEIGSAKSCCVVQCRDHGYESAGSFAAEGIASFLMGDSFLARYLLSHFRVVLLPMTNPDGVTKGLTRFTPGGADLNRLHTRKDPAHEVIKGALDRLRPRAYINFHHWQTKFVDGLLSNEESIANRILAYCPNDSQFAKRWEVETSYEFLRRNRFASSPAGHKSWKNYLKEKYGAYAVTVELPWFLRSPDDMRRRGAEVFQAFLLAVIEDLECSPLVAPTGLK